MAAKPEVTLDEIAAELCALPPKEFTAARNTRAKELGDAGLAAEVRALRKPLLAAWVVNLFAKERADQLGQALDLARELREAQDELDAAALRTLNRQRRELIRGLAQQASDLAGATGENITQATTDAVAQTLNAAMFAADAAAAVASGRLIRPLESTGSGSDLAEAVAGALDTAPEPPESRPADEVKARRERKAAHGDLRAAEAEATQAERERDELEHQRGIAGEQIRRLEQRRAQLEADLARTREEIEQSMRERDELDAGREQVRRRVTAAQRSLAKAQSALDRL